MLRVVFAGVMFLSPLGALAGDWAGETSLGYLSSSGNAQASSLNGKFELGYTETGWQNRFNATAVHSSDSGVTSAERYAASDQVDFNFTEKDFAFFNVEYEKDLFGGIRERTSETFGYGRHVLTGPRHTLDLEAGVGARQSLEQGTGDHEDDLIGRASGKYGLKLSDTSNFSQSLKAESGQSNTYLESVTELKLSIVGNLFSTLSYTVKYNSGAPAGTESTDTATAVNLTYTFGTKSG